MPRWVERRAFTLHPPDRGPPASEQVVRVSLMERVGLASGWFNVREARAQLSESQADAVVAGGRPLSWRWLRTAEAEQLLDERLGTLTAMGYTVVGSVMGTRGRWDWLYDLVHRRVEAAAETPTDSADALRAALSDLGLRADEVITGVASVLGISAEALRDPSPTVARAVDPGQLAVLLPFLLHHDRPEVQALARRWLNCPGVLYQLAPDVLAQWLQSDTAIATYLAPRLANEGPALLGPQRLLHLSRTALAPARDAARRWALRLR